MKQSIRKHWKSLAAFLGITLGGGSLVGFLIRNRMQFYDDLIKPSFAPPGWLFPAAWALLYSMMAVSIWLVYRTGSVQRNSVLVLYFAQLAVNLLWPVLFFVQQALGLGFIWLLLLWALILWLLTKTWKISACAGWMLLPYLLWTTFAGILNFYLAQLNP